MSSRARLWSKLRQRLHGMRPPGQPDRGRCAEFHGSPPPLRILGCGLSESQCDLFRLALVETEGSTDLSLFDSGGEGQEGILSAAADYDLLVMGEEVFSNGSQCLLHRVYSQYPELPVLVVVPESKSDIAGESLADGATGYLLTNELSGPMVRAAIAEVLREKRIESEVRDLDGDDDRDESRDRLTGLLNSELALDFFESEFSSAARWRADVSCLIVRLSRLDDLIQSHGHAFADLIVRNVGNLLGRAVRHADVLTRWSSDEFLLVLPSGTLAQACQRAQQVLALLSAHQFGLFPPALGLSVHIGVASRGESVAAGAQDLIRCAQKVIPVEVSPGARPSVSVWSSLDPLSDDRA